MGNMTVATIFIVLINVCMWFSGLAVESVNPGTSFCFHLEGSIIDNTVTSSGTVPDSTVVNNDVLDDLPESQGVTVNPSSASVSFTDIFNNILSWFKSAPGLRYVYAVVAAPYNVLKCMQLPNLAVAGIGTFWYIVTLLVFLNFMWRGD